MKSRLKQLVGLSVKASETAEECRQFQVYGTFLQHFVEGFQRPF